MSEFDRRLEEANRYVRLYAAQTRMSMPELPSEHLIALHDWFQDQQRQPHKRSMQRGQLQVLLHEVLQVALRLEAFERRAAAAGVALHDH